MAGAANRCLIPEHKFDPGLLTQTLIEDKLMNPSKYSIVLVSEGAQFAHEEEMTFLSQERDAYGHAKLGGIGDKVSAAIKELSPQYNKGRSVNIINQKLGYLVRTGSPDAIDSIVPMAFGNMALDLVLRGLYGRLVVLKNGRYDHVPIEVIKKKKKIVNVDKYYNTERLRPIYNDFEMLPLFIMTSD